MVRNANESDFWSSKMAVARHFEIAHGSWLDHASTVPYTINIYIYTSFYVDYSEIQYLVSDIT